MVISWNFGLNMYEKFIFLRFLGVLNLSRWVSENRFQKKSKWYIIELLCNLKKSKILVISWNFGQNMFKKTFFELFEIMTLSGWKFNKTVFVEKVAYES